jgi:ferric-dicitrate binding protein FerR (iron transport regulator)
MKMLKQRARPMTLDDFDPDIVLITNYLMREMTPEEMAAVEQRLEDDAAFFEKVWPLVEVWDTPVEGLHASDWEEEEAGVAEVIPITRRRRGRLMPVWGWGGLGLAAAASIAIAVVQRVGVQPATVPVFAAKMSTQDSVMKSLEASGALAKLPEAKVIATGPAETRVVVLADSVRVTLAPRSWMAYSDSLLAHPSGDRPAAMVGGEAQVEVPAGKGHQLFHVLTSAGSATLGAGRYALKTLGGVGVGGGNTQSFVRMPKR